MTWLPDPAEAYEERLAAARARLATGERQHFLISNARLATAGVAAIVAFLSAGRHLFTAWWILAPIAAFAILVIVHALQLRSNERVARAIRFYESGLARIEDRWAGGGRGGERFSAAAHPYGRDLDLFGSGSLFELLNTTRTEAGEETLADWLRAPASPVDVRARQAAVAELGSRLDLREDVAVLAADVHVARTGSLIEWASAPPVGLTAAVAWLLGAIAAVTAALVIAGLAGWVDDAIVLVWLALQTAVAFVWRRRVAIVLRRIGTPARDLDLLAELLARIERERLGAARLAAIQRVLHGRPSREIARLQRFVSALDSAENQIFAPIAAALLVRSQMAIAIDRWHARHGGDVAAWLRAIGELEALSALATYAYEHPADPFPDIVEGGALFEGRKVGHPLLAQATAVRNDVAIGGTAARVLVVSGSNMSGKSTLLRAVGVNVVLALAGAPVRASELKLSPLSIGATLRVEDSLQEGRSRFYAEILRIRAVIELTDGPIPVLFLLDEILHGTNSYDRRIGADAIVRSLVRRRAIGLVTTHDLALTELPGSLPGAANVHFEDRLEDGKMVFDYRMRPGVVEHSNALALMRAVGLDV